MWALALLVVHWPVLNWLALLVLQLALVLALAHCLV
jgi:hypothetical protein